MPDKMSLSTAVRVQQWQREADRTILQQASIAHLVGEPLSAKCAARSETQHCWAIRIPLCAAVEKRKTKIVSFHRAGTHSVMQLPLQGYSGTKKWTSRRDKIHRYCGETKADEHYQRKVRSGDMKCGSVFHA